MTPVTKARRRERPPGVAIVSRVVMTSKMVSRTDLRQSPKLRVHNALLRLPGVVSLDGSKRKRSRFLRHASRSLPQLPYV